ncbi:unnamed protein product [Musa banksii]
MTFVFLIPAVAGAICKFIVFPSTMATSGSISLLCLLVVLCFSCSPAMAQPLYQVCDDTGNYTANSTYKSNLDLLLSLASSGSLSGFYNGTAGRSPDQVSGIILCRGDVTTADCSSCLATAGQVLLQLCPNKRGATVWYDDCLVRYSNNQSFFSSTDNSPMAYLVNEKDIAEVSRFDKLVSELMSGIADQAAASNGSSKKFATGTMSNFTSEFPIVYGLVQCTPDLSRSRCRQCLQKLFDVIPNLFEGKQGARAVGVRCNMRYEVYSFYQSTPTLILTAPPASGGSGGSGKKKKNSTGTILAIAIPVATAVLLISIVCICYWRRKSAKKPSYETDPEKITSVESLLFDLSTLRIATCNFSDENKLGEGGFGAVYKGLLPDGREIAVKKLLASEQGLGELKNELVLVAKLQHRNLVRFLGVCFEEEKMLVYEYVPNGSLDKLMFDAEKRERLHWGTRYKIIDGIARGLLYLHEESQHKIIHRDLKASNVLLDSDMSPKITDFGLAKLFGGDQTQGTTSRIVGTFGYMAPEYAMHGHFSAKSDVFSFGVLVLEILTGRKNTGSYDSANSEDLLSYAWERWTAGRGFEILDPVLGIQFPSSDVLKCIKIGLLCVQENPVDRPKMSTVNVMLNSDNRRWISMAHIHCDGKLQRRTKKERFPQVIQGESDPFFSKRQLTKAFIKQNSILTVALDAAASSSPMPPRRAIDVRSGDPNPHKWRVPLTEDAFDSFIAHGGDAARKVFGEGSLFSPLLFGKFFDPGDAFPLWELESEPLLSGLRSTSKTSVDWFETDSEYVLKADLPAARKCEIEVCGPKEKVMDISGLWRGRETDARDWKIGRWWEHGFVRRLELPQDANWKKMEAYITDDILLEIKIPKQTSESSKVHAVQAKESEFV